MVEMPAFLPNFIRYGQDPVTLLVVLVIQLILLGALITGISLTASGVLQPGDGPGGMSWPQFVLIIIPTIISVPLLSMYLIPSVFAYNTPQEMEEIRRLSNVD